MFTHTHTRTQHSVHSVLRSISRSFMFDIKNMIFTSSHELDGLACLTVHRHIYTTHTPHIQRHFLWIHFWLLFVSPCAIPTASLCLHAVICWVRAECSRSPVVRSVWNVRNLGIRWRGAVESNLFIVRSCQTTVLLLIGHCSFVADFDKFQHDVDWVSSTSEISKKNWPKVGRRRADFMLCTLRMTKFTFSRLVTLISCATAGRHA